MSTRMYICYMQCITQRRRRKKGIMLAGGVSLFRSLPQLALSSTQAVCVCVPHKRCAPNNQCSLTFSGSCTSTTRPLALLRTHKNCGCGNKNSTHYTFHGSNGRCNIYIPNTIMCIFVALRLILIYIMAEERKSIFSVVQHFSFTYNARRIRQ